jgi:hypothetical protein
LQAPGNKQAGYFSSYWTKIPSKAKTGASAGECNEPRQAFFACLERSPPALFEAALWIAAEHDPAVQPLAILQALTTLAQQVSMGMPMLPADELASHCYGA